MPDIIDENGLQVSTFTEVKDIADAEMKTIYGSDINLDSNSPDGQFVAGFVQPSIDLREKAVALNNSFDPDSAIGTFLDQRAAINNVERKGGSFTIQPVDIIVNATVNLQGLDANFNDIDGTGYTVQDDAGNEFILIDSSTVIPPVFPILHTTLNFRAREIGEVNVVQNTITNPVTIVLGVTSINNSQEELSLGVDQETDAQLRLRRKQSVALNSVGYLDGMLAALLNVEGVTDAVAFENDDSIVDGDGIPPSGIWAIVLDGANTDIADVIYNKKGAGINMKGSLEVEVTNDSGQVLTMKFDRPTPVTLFMQIFITVTGNVDVEAQKSEIKDYIVDNISYDINQTAEVSEIISVTRDGLESLGFPAFVTDANISIDSLSGPWSDLIDAPTKDSQFTFGNADITMEFNP
jgi:uncharacterized phage protein gp47/JayE